jgi:branched-chain amino acid transport system substrate-binding protein
MVITTSAFAQSQTNIKIGFPMSLSGPSGQFGLPMLQGAQMVADEINAKGGVLGKRIEIIVRDTKTNPEEAAKQARALVTEEHVDFLVGNFTSAEGLAITEVAKQTKVVFLALGPKTIRLTSPASLHPYIFRIAGNTTTEGRTAATIVARWKVKRLATIAPNYSYGWDVVQSFVEQLKKIRPDIEIVNQQWPKINEVNYIPFVEAQLKSRPDAVFSAICCGNFERFTEQVAPYQYFARLNNKFIGVAETGSIEYTRPMKQAYPLGIWGNTYDALNYTPRDEVAAKVHAEFQTKLKAYLHDEYPPSWAIQGYLGMQFLIAAIKKANSIEALKVSSALKGMELMTPFGPMTMRAKDQQLTRGSVWGKMSTSPQYPFPVLSPVEYIDPKILMD